ncbi:hypothetical protein DFH05DRAFT_820722 [Lentinula detonsa]|uniref:Secreted protein n=1 Tax=Lentinula detonsa TaxID=2804962 RepID=A0A9W8P5P1_9AGAR|nr:hypothetical protein DFH05DRAFT_820722 [Lentinula detonsa]KAJ3988072.1 hypothetical protein F5890DRAFT_1494054 [Lentinula detonsa]
MFTAFVTPLFLLILSNWVRSSPLSSSESQHINWKLGSTSRMQAPISLKMVSTNMTVVDTEIDVTNGWVDPRILGGQLLDFTTRHKGEPLNVIISGRSDPYVLSESGFSTYAKSLGFSSECFGLHYGNIHQANLGDGNERQDEQLLARQYYFTRPGGPVLGTCWESLAGGNHFRAWKQNGTMADSGAWFLGVSKEEHSGKHHMIIPDGYNIGRDFLVAQAVSSPTHWNSIWWQTEVEWVEGLLEPGNDGVNHEIEQDGFVAVLTVTRL